MLDIRLIREDPEGVKAAIATLFMEAPIDEIVALDVRRREILTEVEGLKAERNEGSKAVANATAEARPELIAAMRELGDRIAALDEESRTTETELNELMLTVPNLPLPEVPVAADESGNVVYAEWGEKRQFAFTPKPHWELGEALDIIDFERGVKVAGTGFASPLSTGRPSANHLTMPPSRMPTLSWP